ncbi:hypothetical protein NLJ89_g5425 [Agrocybe chaxingu]|uniref:Carboxylesterase type B domain-containing protein n=1 Tax=Agrocybe chaxingu TaxID=84603 RepID=A0A9W8K8B1_9AGAR|nr:hypothetical protein NLJ89_g5425 [Agrocybe chaxingu]
MSTAIHLHDELARNPTRVTVETAFGPIIGGRADNGSVVFLEVPYALPPGRFEDPVGLPNGHRYEAKEYTKESTYGVQPLNDGQAQAMPFEDKVGYGKPSENPLVLNIVIPPSFPQDKNFPVRIYIHGGFLQFGSPHSLGSQAQYIAAERSGIWVNIGYRLSAFGFLASNEPKLNGNYGFKDQWLALQWIKTNIGAFGGESLPALGMRIKSNNPGAHSVHQILHHASLLPEGEQAPFHVAILQSNAMLTDPKTPRELQPQFDALCQALSLDPSAPDILSTLRDPIKVSWESITKVIESKSFGAFGTFRGCTSDDWITTNRSPMEWQRSGSLGRALKARGVQAIVVGDLTEEWYLYSIAHPILGPQDILPNLERYFPTEVCKKLVDAFPTLPSNASSAEATRLYGDILSVGQVYLPVRLLARDFEESGLPVLRYRICWTPEQYRPEGYVTHGCDRLLWALRTCSLESDQTQIARQWIDRVFKEIDAMRGGNSSKDARCMLALKEDKSIGWTMDEEWDWMMKLEGVLNGN